MATKVNNLQAAAYAKPHTMSGKSVKVAENPGKLPNRSKLDAQELNIGNISKAEGPATKTAGTVTRGNGAATKGITARGPMC